MRKAGGRRWKRWSEAEAREWLERLTASGESFGAFCERHAVNESRLRRWHRRLAEPGAGRPARFIEAVIADRGTDGAGGLGVPVSIRCGELTVEVSAGAQRADVMLVCEVLRDCVDRCG